MKKLKFVVSIFPKCVRQMRKPCLKAVSSAIERPAWRQFLQPTDVGRIETQSMR